MTLPNDQKALIAAMPDMPPEEMARTRRLVASGASAPLSADKETGPFMLFLLGDDIESVAIKTGLPKDVVLLTASQYRWREKRELLVEKGKEGELIKDVEKALLNNLLMATYKAVTAEVGLIMAGKLEPEKAQFVPKSMQALQRLLEMIERANKLVVVDQTKPPVPAPGTTVVHAQNVQINNTAVNEDEFEAKRRAFLQQMASKAEIKEG